MKIPNLTIQQLLEAGVHLGHKTLRWNPKMKKYIFGKRDSIHIIDLTQTLELTKVALEKVHSTIANNGKITKKTKAIICVHLAGLPCDMISIRKIASKHKIKIIEDIQKEKQELLQQRQVLFEETQKNNKINIYWGGKSKKSYELYRNKIDKLIKIKRINSINKAYSKDKEQFEIAQKLKWYGELLKISSDEEESEDAEDFVNTVKGDILEANVYVFTPKGEVIELPKGATPIDFAYRIHTDVGHKMVGATVNNRIVTLDYSLKTGDIVSVKTNKNAFGPSDAWLKIAKVQRLARFKILTDFAADVV